MKWRLLSLQHISAYSSTFSAYEKRQMGWNIPVTHPYARAKTQKKLHKYQNGRGAPDRRLWERCYVGGFVLRWSSICSDWEDGWVFVANPECEASLCEQQPFKVSLVAETESGCKWDGSPFDLFSSEKEMGMIFGNGEAQLISFTMQKKSSWLLIRNGVKTRPSNTRASKNQTSTRPTESQTFTCMHSADQFIKRNKSNLKCCTTKLQSKMLRKVQTKTEIKDRDSRERTVFLPFF